MKEKKWTSLIIFFSNFSLKMENFGEKVIKYKYKSFSSSNKYRPFNNDYLQRLTYLIYVLHHQTTSFTFLSFKLVNTKIKDDFFSFLFLFFFSLFFFLLLNWRTHSKWSKKITIVSLLQKKKICERLQMSWILYYVHMRLT